MNILENPHLAVMASQRGAVNCGIKLNSFLWAVAQSFCGAVFAGMIVFIATTAPAQNLFVTGYYGNITEVTQEGMQSTFASGLNGLGPLAFASAGDLLVGNGPDITKITPEGVESTFASGVNASGLAFNSSGDLFVAAAGSYSIYEFTPSGAESTFATGLVGIAGLTFNSTGNLFVTDYGNIYEFTPDGMRSTFASGSGTIYGDALAFDSAGDLFEADYVNGNIYKFTPTGVRSTFASGLDGPIGLAFNNVGDLFEGDIGSGNIYEFTPDGTRSTFVSGLSYPEGLAFQPTPEPSSLWLVLLGSGIWFYVRRIHRRQRVA